MRRILFAAITLSLAGAAFAAKDKDVNVVNEPQVKAEITNDAPIAVEGELSVSGPLDATIINTPANPVAVTGSLSRVPREPYRETFHRGVDDNHLGFVELDEPINVPEGKVFMLTHVYFHGQHYAVDVQLGDAEIAIDVQTSPGAYGTALWVPMRCAPEGTGLAPSYGGHTRCAGWAEVPWGPIVNGDHVRAELQSSSGTGRFIVGVTLLGYLVDG